MTEETLAVVVVRAFLIQLEVVVALVKLVVVMVS